MNVFDHVIAGLEQRGAFKDVPGAVMPREIMGKLEAANAEQKKIAATAIEEITISMSQDNFLINLGRAIAHTYHTRIQKEQGDYTKPMTAEDFTKTWQEFADTDGFKTDVAMGDDTMITIRCPFGPAANHQSAVDVGSEVCQAPEARKGSAAHLGYGLLKRYSGPFQNR